VSARALVALPAVVIAAGSLTACSSDKIDAGSVEDKLSGELQQLGAQPKVHCPGGQRAAAGTHFTCTATVGGRKLPIDVTMTARDRFTYQVRTPRQ
jgi:hypothetical protein